MFSLFGKRRDEKNNKGFTLVELMIVVAVMAVLVAVAIPIYNGVTGNAEKQTCITNMRIISDTLNNYHAGFEGEYIEVPDFTISREEGYPKFTPEITDPLKARFLASTQDPICLCCTNESGVIHVETSADGTKVSVWCDKHSDDH